ncbi:DoxX-like family protein [Leptospira ognonensis]|uniref:DoxX-like family protein n=1 Tax=Leptospira ognonensis TaxID=2484945 RepID=A0A4R9K1Q5_9LEPT|nr:DoxX-like family protein [Leptospira ognonensis]TGL59081.1 DoxX-like family protein [Leptospira ognonensis]
MSKLWIVNAVKLAVGIIFLQTLFFKFSAAEESVFIFSSLGAEPWGRIGSGVIELLIVALLLFPRLVWLGALLGIGTMIGALGAHIFVIGIEISQDHGLLFFLALFNFLGCGFLLFRERETLLMLLKKVRKQA